MKVIFQQETFTLQFLREIATDLVLQFRNMWFYLVLFIMRNDGSWPKEWLPVVSSLAESTPLLVPKKSQRSLVADLFSNSILRGVFSDLVLYF